MRNIYTDLAVELHDIIQQEKNQGKTGSKKEYEIEGVNLSVSKAGDDIEITTVEVLRDETS